MIHKETLITCFLSKRISGCFGEELALAISACLFFFLEAQRKVYMFCQENHQFGKKKKRLFEKNSFSCRKKKKKSGNIQYLIIKWGIRHET